MYLPQPPKRGTEAYRWWHAGVTDEARLRDEELNKAARDVRDVVEGLARLNPRITAAELAADTFYIFAGPLPWKMRLKLALRGRL